MEKNHTLFENFETAKNKMLAEFWTQRRAYPLMAGSVPEIMKIPRILKMGKRGRLEPAAH